MTLLAVVLVLLLWAGHRRARLIERSCPPVGTVRRLDGHDVHVVEAGSGPPLILLHGASSNLRDWTESILPILAREFRVIAIDRPGLGHSAGTGAWLNPSDLADFVLNVAEELGAEAPVIVGHSWSGSVVLAALTDQPDRVAGGISLAGVASHWVGGIGWATHVARVPILGQLFCHTVVPLLGPSLMPAAIAKIFRPNAVPDGYAERIGAALAVRPRAFWSNARDLVRLNAYLQAQSTRYPTIRRPLLVMHGESDAIVPFWNHGQRLAALLPDAEVQMLPGLGHAPHHVEPDAIAGRIADFARRCFDNAAAPGQLGGGNRSVFP